ncbi:DUF695 domain-containing protein [Phytohabitans houttuyneae]|uniref:DUF695 domain-containing protein n=1 Tax=Phytohabitans houttuyneae TaxID=1076126 RepID=A0A6V8KPY3_9ACTN|nr:DUF695 domain-containing protein [Phytohabitans houttuyneae]GFJ82725.1 hypothetical protein Phou_069050 [Phytohabitans houttuyneae]
MIFSRRRAESTPSPDAAIDAFWRWWPGARSAVEAAVASGEWGDLSDRINALVEAIHADLHWEFSRGVRATHALVVSPAGAPPLRAVAARWLAAAPPADETWEYHSSRQPDPAAFGARLQIAGAELAMEDLRYGFAVEAGRQLLDVTVYHPMFADLPDDVRGQISFLSLDWLLGEEGVERWVGAVEFGGAPPAEAYPPAELRAAVERQAVEFKEPAWVMLSAQDKKGWPILATAQQPLLPVRFPRFDTHVAVTLPFREANDGGLPLDGSLTALREFEDELTDALAGDGDLLAHETSRSTRVLHFYVDGSTGAAALVEGRLGGWREGRARVETAYDPSLEHIAHLNTA